MFDDILRLVTAAGDTWDHQRQMDEYMSHFHDPNYASYIGLVARDVRKGKITSVTELHAELLEEERRQDALA